MGFRTKTRGRLLGAAFLMTVITACGGGGDGGGSDGGPSAPPPPSAPPAPSLLKFGVHPSAAVVIGQSDFYQGAEGQGEPEKLNQPAGAPGITSDGRLVVADRGHNQLKVFNDYASANGPTPDASMTTPFPSGVAAGGGKLVVLDIERSVSIYSAAPTPLDPDPEPEVYGTGVADCNDTDMISPRAASITPKGHLIVADTGGSRVLIWNTIPAAGPLGPAHVVVGQKVKGTCAANDHDGDGTSETGPNGATLDDPSGVWSDGNRLIVADESNHRVLIWKNMPTTDFQSADFVLGQRNKTDFARNAGQPSASSDSLDSPNAVDVSETGQLAVADHGNHRVLIWNTIPQQDAQPADQVIGQSDFVQSGPNGRDGEVGPQTLRLPAGVRFHQRNLIVVDQGNNRVLVWKAVD